MWKNGGRSARYNRGVMRWRRMISGGSVVMSLLVCVAIAVVWVRSLGRPYWAQRSAEFPGRAWTWEGGIYLGRMQPAQSGASYFRIPAAVSSQVSDWEYV